ncbi:MAG: DUF1016 N-terminal domain-containing protein [Oscillospiraceae bacterium]|nr:DUF1016 N-terminal domain-containing protein [Oscillospiraceae bacterium]
MDEKLDNNDSMIVSSAFYNDIKKIIVDSKNATISSVDFQRVLMYWCLGERIFVEEQEGKNRAEYDEFLFNNLSKQLESEFGSGFSYHCRKFYRFYPIASALRT